MKESVTLETILGTAKKPGGGKDYMRGLNKGGNTKQPGQVSAATRYARDLFLHGNGDGKPVTDTVRLAEKAGISIATVERWRPVWERERVALARRETAGKVVLRESVTAAELAWHSAKVNSLKLHCDKLEKALEKLPAGTDLHANTLKLLSATLKTWAEESGLHEHFETQAVAAREMIKIAARAARADHDKDERVINPGFAFTVDSVPGDKGK